MVTKISHGGARVPLALLTLMAVLTMPGFGLGGLASALAQTDSGLDRALEHYEFAEFDQALAILDGIIADSSQSDEVLRDAYILRARCHVGLGNRNSAEDAFCEVLNLDPDWEPDPVFFPADEVDVFAVAKMDCPTKTAAPAAAPVVAASTGSSGGGGTPFYKKPLVWAGAAAVVVIALVAGGGGGGDDEGEPSLAGPPAPPDPPVK